MSQDIPYDDQAWQKYVSVQELSNDYHFLGWSGTGGSWRQRNLDTIVQYITLLYDLLKEPVTVLDVACFTGEYCGKLLEIKNIQHKFKYVGCDVTKNYIDYATNKYKNHDHVGFMTCNAKNLPFNDNSFDIVFNSGMLIHMDDVEPCIKEFARVSKNMILIETTIDNTQATYRAHRFTTDLFLSYTYKSQYIENIIKKFMLVVDINIAPYVAGNSYLFINKKHSI